MKKEDFKLKYGNIVELKDGRRLLCVKSFDKKDAFIDLKSEECVPVRLRDFMKVYEDYTLQNLLWERKEKPILTEDEKAILRNIDKDYKWIARDKNTRLFAYPNEPYKHHGALGWLGNNSESMQLFKHLFQFIQWEDTEPYLIGELLED